MDERRERMEGLGTDDTDASIAQIPVHLLDVRVRPDIQTLEAGWACEGWNDYGRNSGCGDGGEKYGGGERL